MASKVTYINRGDWTEVADALGTFGMMEKNGSQWLAYESLDDCIPVRTFDSRGEMQRFWAERSQERTARMLALQGR